VSRDEITIIPDRLDDWTHDTVATIVQDYDYEPGWFDYKEVLTPTRGEANEHRKSICRTACSMANASGGYILFGVRDAKARVSTPISPIVGIPLSDHRKELADKLTSIEPSLHFDTMSTPIPLPNNETRVVFVVHIPRSPFRPHMYEGTFLRRGSGGSAETMNIYEVREQMLNTEERMRKATLLQLELKTFRRQLDHLRSGNSIAVRGLVRFDVGTFKLLLADICPLLANDILADLVQIPVLASMVNEQVQQLLSPPQHKPEIGYTDNPHNNLGSLTTDLFNLCVRAEQHLAYIFGPLSESLLPQQNRLLR